jgi:endoglycosylceramidase
MVDAHGRVRIFHGANVSGRAKVPPFLPLEDASARSAARMGMEPGAAGAPVGPPAGPKYDDAYLDRIVALAGACHAQGLHVIVDLHQDLFSRHYGGEVRPRGLFHPSPARAVRRRIWFAELLLVRSRDRRARSLLAQRRRDQDRYHDMLTHVGRRFATVPGVLGYDLWNEPVSRPGDTLGGSSGRRSPSSTPRDRVAPAGTRRGSC